MPVKIGYKALLEVHEPNNLLSYVELAEKLGFDSAWVDDHFHPWAHTGAQGSFTWTWMSSAAERTNRIVFGTSVTAPTFRYHPAIVAQAFATMEYMYPNRFFLGVGTGEALNETPLGFKWPSPRQRVEMLEEALIIERRLWTERFVNFEGKYYHLKKANLYTKPKNPPKIYVAVGGPKMAEVAGRLGDGIILDSGLLLYDPEKLRNLLQIFNKTAEKEGKDPESLAKAAELMISYDDNHEVAIKSCRFWTGCMLPLYPKYDIYDPREIEALGAFVGKERVERRFLLGNDTEEHLEKIQKYIDFGFNNIIFLNSGPNEKKFIEIYGEKILPRLRSI